MSPAAWAVRAVCLGVALALGVASGAEFTASRATGIGADLRTRRVNLEQAAQILETGDRLWPARRDAAFERARVAFDQRNIRLAGHWLMRSQGRVPNVLRWNQVAGNVLLQLGRERDAVQALGVAMALNPNAPADERRAFEELRAR